jgi:hypothetical protein
VEEHAKEEPHLDLRVQEGRYESKMVESIHVGKYGGYELPLVEGPLKAPVVVAKVVSGPMLQGRGDSDRDASLACWHGYITDMWDLGSNDTNKVSV